MTDYFSDREQGARSRTLEEIDEATWQGLYAIVENRINRGAFGYGCPESCPDGSAICGTNVDAFWRQGRAEIPDLSLVKGRSEPQWPPSPYVLPPTLAILDFLEFAARTVGEPIQGTWHEFFKHHHLTFDRQAGLDAFIDDVNRILARGRIAFELTPDGRVQRFLPEPVAHVLRETLFRTGDDETDDLLEKARELIASPKLDARRDAIEKLWDAFERIKTLEPGANKRKQAEALLARATASAGPLFSDTITKEARSLTEIGNDFRIRHSEADKEIVDQPAQIDYLFLRMFAFVRYLLSTTGRGG